jgi:hypothetical protein
MKVIEARRVRGKARSCGGASSHPARKHHRANGAAAPDCRVSAPQAEHGPNRAGALGSEPKATRP